MLKELARVSAAGIAIMLSGLSLNCGGANEPEADGAGVSSEDELVKGKFTFDRKEIGRIDIEGGTFCTATLIGTRTLLSAAHCVNWKSVDDPGTWHGDFTVQTSLHESQTFQIDGFVSYGTKDKGGADDITVLRLTDPVPASLARPATLATKTPRDDERVTIFGYGCTDRGGWDGKRPDDDRHSGKKQKRTFDLKPVRFMCPGDSGGPTVVGADGPVFRVSSWYYFFDLFGIGKPDKFGDVVKHRDRILQQVRDWGG